MKKKQGDINILGCFDTVPTSKNEKMEELKKIIRKKDDIVIKNK